MKSLSRPSLLLATAWLAGCAAGGGARTDAPAASVAGDPETILEQRSVERWKLMVAGKAAEAYDYLSPGFRVLKSREQYAREMGDRPVKWTGVAFRDVECPPPGEYCDVTVDVDYEMQSPLQGVGTLKSTGPVVERWIAVDGVWYLVPKEVARK